ncbi:hypothetical protein [Mameliella alba]|uniref:hypothetical protein n=1 Tax=Mameliella alba TaxID=561184 RepID=UPI001554374C|nr:hypothetical protein [Mameliella alba]
MSARITADGGFAFIDIGTTDGTRSVMVPADMLQIFQDRIRQFAAAAEDQRRKAGGSNMNGEFDQKVASARVVQQVGVGVAEGRDEIGVQFLCGGVPEVFMITKEQARELAQRLRAHLV